METKKPKRKSGIPTGHAGEYLVSSRIAIRGDTTYWQGALLTGNCTKYR
jgi:hypothetical protein